MAISVAAPVPRTRSAFFRAVDDDLVRLGSLADRGVRIACECGRAGCTEALRGDDRTRRIPLIFLSGQGEAAVAARAHELGALACPTKAFDPPALVSVVAGVLARIQPLTAM